MESLSQKQLAFLDDTIKHYNSNNLCIDQDGFCCYSPETLKLGDKSEGCAIGRHLTKEVALQIDTIPSPNYDVGTSVENNEIFNLLPVSLKELTQKFLYAIQMLHDNPLNWDEKGLTRCGEDYVKVIKNSYSL